MGLGSERPRTYGPLAWAVGLHALLLGAIGSLVAPTRALVLPRASLAEAEVDLVEDTAPPSDRAASHAVPAPSLVEPKRSLHEPTASTAPPASSLDEPTAPVTEERGSWTLSVTQVDIGVGIGAHPSQVHVGVGRSLPEPGGSQSHNTGGVSEALAEHDVSMGLGRGGMVRTAVEGAVQASTAMGNATFEIRIDAGGHVRVDVADVSGDRALWARLETAIADEVTAKRGQVRMPPGGQGLEVVVRAEAIDKLVDGRKASSLGNHVEASGGITETKDQIVVTPPGVTLKHDGKVCSAGIHVGADRMFVQQSAGSTNSVDSPTVTFMPISIGGGCSPEALGTVPIRVVAARIVSESVL